MRGCGFLRSISIASSALPSPGSSVATETYGTGLRDASSALQQIVGENERCRASRTPPAAARRHHFAPGLRVRSRPVSPEGRRRTPLLRARRTRSRAAARADRRRARATIRIATATGTASNTDTIARMRAVGQPSGTRSSSRAGTSKGTPPSRAGIASTAATIAAIPASRVPRSRFRNDQNQPATSASKASHGDGPRPPDAVGADEAARGVARPPERERRGVGASASEANAPASDPATPAMPSAHARRGAKATRQSEPQRQNGEFVTARDVEQSQGDAGRRRAPRRDGAARASRLRAQARDRTRAVAPTCRNSGLTASATTTAIAAPPDVPASAATKRTAHNSSAARSRIASRFASSGPAQRPGKASFGDCEERRVGDPDPGRRTVRREDRVVAQVRPSRCSAASRSEAFHTAAPSGPPTSFQPS